jgi:hypothetical protein
MFQEDGKKSSRDNESGEEMNEIYIVVTEYPSTEYSGSEYVVKEFKTREETLNYIETTVIRDQQTKVYKGREIKMRVTLEE